MNIDLFKDFPASYKYVGTVKAEGVAWKFYRTEKGNLYQIGPNICKETHYYDLPESYEVCY